MTIESPTVQEPNWNGPVPTGLFSMVPMADSFRMTPCPCVRKNSRLALTWLRVITTSWSSSAVMSTIGDSVVVNGWSGLFTTLFSEKTTSSAVKGSPLWKVTLCRRWNVYVSPSSLTSHLSASSGVIEPSGWSRTNVS